MKRLMEQLSQVVLNNAHELQLIKGGIILVLAMIVANAFNLLTNILIGERLSIAEFGHYTFFMSLVYLINVPLAALSLTVTLKTSKLLRAHSLKSANFFWQHLVRRTFLFGSAMSLLLVIGFTLFSQYLSFPMWMSLTLLIPFIFSGLLKVVNEGYLMGRLAFIQVAVIFLAEAASRTVFTLLISQTHWEELTVLAVPLASIAAAALATFLASGGQPGPTRITSFRLSKSFFSLALLSKVATLSFFTLDTVILNAKLSDVDAGVYGLLSLLGKVLFFAGSMIIFLMIPLVVRHFHQKRFIRTMFWLLMIILLGILLITYLGLGSIISIAAAAWFGNKFNSIAPYFWMYGAGVLCFIFGQGLVQYFLATRRYLPITISVLALVGHVVALQVFASDINQAVKVIFLSSVVQVTALIGYGVFRKSLVFWENNVKDFVGLFLPAKTLRLASPRTAEGKRVLILNWRDQKHGWAGGAESYIQEIGKRLVKDGFEVTLFCGNDGKSAREDVVDGIKIIRRGGFYTVYWWAMVYYLTWLRKHTDVVIDCENGIPFLSPLYVRKPIVLLVHHIHQNVFREHLPFPLSEIASFIEADLMTLCYRNTKVVTISPSSLQDINDLGLARKSAVQMVHPGIATRYLKPRPKTAHPSCIYVGRLKPYKNVDVAIKAFASVMKEFPQATLSIVGSGESEASLKHLVATLGLGRSVIFKGNVSEQQKAKLLAQSWVALQPSMLEGWGITVIEANAAGTPVIAANVKGLRDSVRHRQTGLLVKAGSHTAFAKALSKLFKDDAYRQELGEQAIKWSKFFSWDVSAEQFSAILQQRKSTFETPFQGINKVRVAHEF